VYHSTAHVCYVPLAAVGGDSNSGSHGEGVAGGEEVRTVGASTSDHAGEQPTGRTTESQTNTDEAAAISSPSDQAANRSLNANRLRTPPPSYSGPPSQPLFLPYITQELPCYADIDNPVRESDSRRLGFVHRSEGHYVPMQIPGYIPEDLRDPPVVR
jgi:hypothetical protein